MKRYLITFFLIIGIIAISQLAPFKVTADEAVTIKENYTSTEKTDYRDGIFPNFYEENEKKYILKNVEIEIIEENITSEAEIKEVESGPINKGTSYNPPSSITDNNKVYYLENVEVLEEAEQVEQMVITYTDYDETTPISSVPKEKVYTTHNSLTGEPCEVICALESISTLPTEYEDTYIDIVFEQYDAEYFIWGDLKVEKDSSYPLKGYEQQLLQSAGYSDKYRVKNIYWLGEPFVNESGILVRNGRADIVKEVSRYRANYIASVSFESYSYYKAIYKSKEEVSYGYEAIATYVPDSSNIAVIATGIGILFLAVAIVVILFVLAKKRKKHE